MASSGSKEPHINLTGNASDYEDDKEPVVRFTEDTPLKATLAVEDLRIRSYEVEYQARTLEESARALFSKKERERAVEIYLEAQTRFVMMRPTAAYAIRPTKKQKEAMKKYIQGAKESLARIETILRKERLFDSSYLNGPPSMRNVESQVYDDLEGFDNPSALPKQTIEVVCELRDKEVQTAEVGTHPMITMEAPSASSVDPAGTAENQGANEQDDDVIIVNNDEEIEFFSLSAEPKKAQPSGRLGSEVHVVTGGQQYKIPHLPPQAVLDQQELLAEWSEFKKLYELHEKTTWKYSKAWRQYYLYATMKSNRRRPPKEMAGRCRYCFVMEKTDSHGLHGCKQFRDLHACERLVWIIIFELCHNCFSLAHLAECCPAIDGCECKNHMCQCEVTHNHSSLLCGGELVPGPEFCEDYEQVVKNSRIPVEEPKVRPAARAASRPPSRSSQASGSHRMGSDYHHRMGSDYHHRMESDHHHRGEPRYDPGWKPCCHWTHGDYPHADRGQQDYGKDYRGREDRSSYEGGGRERRGDRY